jgi:hypothetical protein
MIMVMKCMVLIIRSNFFEQLKYRYISGSRKTQDFGVRGLVAHTLHNQHSVL